MRYDAILAEALSQASALPKKPPLKLKPIAPTPPPKPLELKLESLPAQQVNVNYDTAHLEALIEKLQELVAVAPVINVAAQDNAALAEAMIAQGEHLTKLGRLLTRKQTINCTILRDEDGKMAQIIIEKE